MKMTIMIYQGNEEIIDNILKIILLVILVLLQSRNKTYYLFLIIDNNLI